jgi:amino-acid N-acetyltransferase
MGQGGVVDPARFSTIAHADHALLSPIAPARLDSLLDRLDVPERGVALDVGCGKGEARIRLAARAGHARRGRRSERRIPRGGARRGAAPGGVGAAGVARGAHGGEGVRGRRVRHAGAFGTPARDPFPAARPSPKLRGMSGALPTVMLRRARPEDLPRVESLLADAKLPTEGVRDHFGGFLVASTAGGVVAAIGLEHYGEAALLRSAVVEPGSRGRGIASLLTMRLLEDARAAGVRAVYLLTETAQGFFERAGFRAVPREQIPVELHASAELSGARCAGAACMVKVLG